MNSVQQFAAPSYCTVQRFHYAIVHRMPRFRLPRPQIVSLHRLLFRLLVHLCFLVLIPLLLHLLLLLLFLGHWLPQMDPPCPVLFNKMCQHCGASKSGLLVPHSEIVSLPFTAGVWRSNLKLKPKVKDLNFPPSLRVSPGRGRRWRNYNKISIELPN